MANTCILCKKRFFLGKKSSVWDKESKKFVFLRVAKGLKKV